MVVLVLTFTPGNAVKSGWPGLRKMIVLHGRQLHNKKWQICRGSLAHATCLFLCLISTSIKSQL